ncbi:hypothetical protein GF374_03225 [Candidatus Woesearchaeota archaeon]|nr:hypothetical protein [Candidatus Woesearchaeota archaeon]
MEDHQLGCKFDKPVNVEQLYNILKKVAKDTKSNLFLKLKVLREFWHGDDLENKTEDGTASFSDPNTEITFFLKHHADITGKESLFEGVYASGFELQEFPSVRDYAQTIANKINEAYKESK